MYALGIDLGDPTTSWARSSAGADSPDAEGVVPSAVGVGPGGTLTVVDPDGEAALAAVSGFVGALGSSEPVIVGGTPYGVDALVACVLSAIVASSADATGSPPDRVVLVHADDLDPYVESMLTEAARVAGIGADRLALLPRATSLAAAGTAAAGASLVGAQGWPRPSSGTGGIAAGAGGVAAGGTAGVIGAVAFGADVAEGGVAAAAGPAAGPAGSAIGPAGPATGPSVGPSGSSIGPGGSSVGPGGSSGVAGPGGSGALVTGTSTFPWIPAVIGGAIAVVAVVVAVVVVAGGEDPPPEQATAVVTTDVVVVESSPAIEPASTASVDTDVATTEAATTSEPASPTTVNPDIDLSAFVGGWVVCSASTSGANVSAAVEYEFAPAGPNQLALEYVVLVYPDSTDCSTTGIPSTETTSTVDVVGETVIDGVQAIQVNASDGPFVMGVVGDTLRYGKNPSGEGFPTAFDPTLVYSRRL